MSEIEKLYARAMIEPLSITVCGVGEQIINYPPFTAEKQLGLICWLVNNKDSIMITNKPKPINLEVLKESIAYGINLLWQDLTEDERKQIADILRR